MKILACRSCGIVCPMVLCRTCTCKRRKDIEIWKRVGESFIKQDKKRTKKNKTGA